MGDTLAFVESSADFGDLSLHRVSFCQFLGFGRHVLHELVVHHLIASHPVISGQSFQRGAFVHFSTEDAVDEPFELGGEEAGRFSGFVECPEPVEVLGLDEAVDVVLWPSAEEGGSAVVHDEEDNSGSEQVGLESSVVALHHLHGFVALSPHSGAQAVVSVGS